MKSHIIKTALFFLMAFALMSCGTTSENNSDIIDFDPVDIHDGWDISTAAEQGLDTARLYEMYQEASQISHLYSLIIVKNGFLVAEAYFNGKGVYDANSIASVTKSVVSALAGIALEQNILSGVNQKMLDFFPEINWAAQDSRKSLITLQQILQMRSGYPWEEFEGYLDMLLHNNAWIPYLAEFPLTSDPGTQFGYSNFTVHMMGIILARASEQSLLQFGNTHLFNPLGVSVPYWPTDAYGYYYGSGDIYFTPRHMARFGLLYLNRGLYRGNRIIPEQWIEDSFESYSTTTYETDILESIRGLEYGYLWWSGTSGSRRFNFAWGHGGQLVCILDDLNMVIVTAANALVGQIDIIAWLKTKAIMEMVGRYIASF